MHRVTVRAPLRKVGLRLDQSTEPMSRIGTRTLALISVAVLAACGGTSEQPEGRSGGQGGRGERGGPAQVGFVVVQQTSVPLVTELAGRTFAYQSSEVRPQVGGVIQRRFFEEGSIVRRGEPLYQIDPSLFRAAVNEASANVASARATAEAARIRSDRLRPLAEMEAVSKQDFTDAVATQRQAEASIAQNQAQLETARINLRFTTVPAPITGRIGRSVFTVGALVTPGQADPLTTIQQLDPIYVDIQQSAAALLQLRRRMANGGVLPASATVRLKLEDGSDYGATGSVEFSEVVVDQQTGTVTLRARFPNPNGLLLPGMFVRAVFAQAIETNAFLVPQTAVARDAKGDATVWIVGQGNKAVQRTVQAVRAEGANWIVTGGLQPGDRVITQGTANLRANPDIRPVPASSPQQPKPPSPEQLKEQQKAQGKAR